MNKKPIAILGNFSFHLCTLGLGDHELRVVFTDQHEQLISDEMESADQIPAALFQTFSFGAVFRSKVHCSSSGVQEEPAGPSGLDGPWTIDLSLRLNGLMSFRIRLIFKLVVCHLKSIQF